MADPIGFAESIWGEVPDNLQTGMPNFFRGPRKELGIYIGLLPIQQRRNRIEWQFWDNITPFVTRDADVKTVTYRVWLWWNHNALYGALSLERDQRRIASEFPLRIYEDALARIQYRFPDDEKLHLIPFDPTGELDVVTETDLTDGIEVAVIQTMDFNKTSNREAFLERIADAATG